MTDVGDDFTIRTSITVDGVPVDPATVDLSVTRPIGTTTHPTITNTAVGDYEATETAIEPGRWRWTWTTTGPAGIDHGFIDVAGAPPARLDPLATVADVEARLGRELTAAEAAQAHGLLLSASARVRAFCRQTISRVDDDTVIVRPVHNSIRLKERPVIDVASVATVGDDGQADQTLTAWSWDGGDIIRILDARLTNAYQVVYSHGYDVVSDLVVDVCAGAVVRVLASPTAAEGVTQLTVGQFSEQFQQREGAPGRAVRLSATDRKDLIDAGFRVRATTIQVGT